MGETVTIRHAGERRYPALNIEYKTLAEMRVFCVDSTGDNQKIRLGYVFINEL